MQTKPDPPYHFICHVDHFTKFHILFPLEHKLANEVARSLIERVFSLFRLPTILHSDNGTEFVNCIIQATSWCHIINGNPGHSQSQGLVEQGNQTIEMMISARETENDFFRSAKFNVKLSMFTFYFL